MSRLATIIFVFALLLAGCASPTAPVTPQPFRKIVTYSEFGEVLREGKGRKMMLVFYADWEMGGVRMKAEVFTRPDVIKALQPLVVAEVDLTKDDGNSRSIKHTAEVYGPPALLFLNEDSTRWKVVYGLQTPQQLIAIIQKFKSSSRR